jgi:hypothetical protein
MSVQLARRSLPGWVSAATFVGVDPVGRALVASAFAHPPSIANPDLDGVFTTDPGTLVAAADDFRDDLHRTPVAATQLASVEDVAAVGGAGQHGVIVRARRPTVPVPPKTRRCAIHYTDVALFFEDLNAGTFESKVDGGHWQNLHRREQVLFPAPRCPTKPSSRQIWTSR